MNQQPDKLFKAKLENYQRPVPASAWSRIESGLSKKNNRALWLRIAASLLFVALVSVGIHSILKKDDPKQIVAEHEPIENLTPQSDKNNSASETLTPNDKAEIAAKENHKRYSPGKTSITKVDRPVTKNKTKSHPETTTPLAETVAESQELTEDESISVDETIAQDDTRKNFKLVIEADQVNEKYLTKRTIAKATSQDDNSSGIKKLLDKANDLKNNQDPFGDLRHMKDEILALNFQSNKKQEQNK